MTTKPRRSSIDALRRHVEERLSQRQAGAEVRPAFDVRKLIHELEVHEMELELQNEELRGARVELEAALARYTELFDFAPLGYATIGSDGVIRELNLAGANLLGRERARLIGMQFSQFVSVQDHDAFRDLLRRARESDTKEVAEFELYLGRNTARQARLTATGLVRGQSSVLLAFEDISEAKTRAERLEQSERALRDADQRKDDFLAALSHELRNPLTPIRNSVYMLANLQLSVDETQRAYAVIDRQVTQLTRLIDDLLDVTRISRGKVLLKKERVELTALVRRTVEDHEHSFQVRGIALEAEIESRELWVFADLARVVQVVSNLLGNAEKFTPRGGRVAVSLVASKARAVLRVVDTGAGIEPAMLPKVFEPFTQAPQTLERSRGGLGLGLSMVKGLVELHDGTVELYSAGMGRGTEVTIVLPLDRLSAAPGEVVEPIPLKQLRVLIIEDNQDTADTLRMALSSRGHDVEAVYDGTAGLQRALIWVPDVVLCDIGLPNQDGYAVARAMRREPALMKVCLIAVTGYAGPEDVQRAEEAGFDRHLSKPANLERLMQIFTEISVARAESAAQA